VCRDTTLQALLVPTDQLFKGVKIRRPFRSHQTLMTKLHDQVLQLGNLTKLYQLYTLNIDDKTARRRTEFRQTDDAVSVIHFKALVTKLHDEVRKLGYLTTLY
jgi:hypothetical protein